MEGRYRITTSWQTASDLRRHPDWRGSQRGDYRRLWFGVKTNPSLGQMFAFFCTSENSGRCQRFLFLFFVSLYKLEVRIPSLLVRLFHIVSVWVQGTPRSPLIRRNAPINSQIGLPPVHVSVCQHRGLI